MRQGVKLCRRKYFGIADPDLPIHYATSTGLRWWLRVVYSWAPSMLSVFGQKKPSVPFWGCLTLNWSFIARKNPSTGLTCTRTWEKKE